MAHAAGTLYMAPDGDVLMLRRASTEDNYPGHWALPGGGGEDGETQEQTAHRKATEEMGSAPEGKRKLIGRKTTPTGMTFYTFAQPVEDKFQPRLNDEHSGFAWVPLAELMKAIGEIGLYGAADMASDDGDWNEGAHPRAQNGQFGAGGSSSHASPVGTGAKAHSGVRNGVDAGEAASIKHYTEAGFKSINWGLRGIRQHTPETTAHLAELDRVMSRASLPEALTVHRGIGGNGLKEILKHGLKKGSIIPDSGFLSTTKNSGVGKTFQNSSDNIMLEIRLPKGAKAVDLGKLSDNPGEQEVLLDRNSKLKVVSFNSKTKTVVMELMQ